MEYIYLGKIVNTHGIRGEVRILSDFRYKKRIFVPGMSIYIGKMKEKEVIASYRVHKNFDMITMKGYTNINEVLKYKGLSVYFSRQDLSLGKDEFLDEDLIGMNVLFRGEVMGQVERILSGKQSQLLVKNGDKYYYIPYVLGVVSRIDQRQGIILEDIDGLFDFSCYQEKER